MQPLDTCYTLSSVTCVTHHTEYCEEGGSGLLESRVQIRSSEDASRPRERNL